MSEGQSKLRPTVPAKLRQHPPELSKEDQLKKTLAEIKALTGAAPQPTSIGTAQESPSQAPPAPAEPPAAPTPIRELNPNLDPETRAHVEAAFRDPEPLVAQQSLKPKDLVQVCETTSRQYGLVFQIGDVRAGRAHGYYILTGGRVEYVTVDVKELRRVGTAVVHSKKPVSPKWAEQR